MLSENANFRINNVHNAFSLLMEYGITHMHSRQNFGGYSYICYISEHFLCNSEVYNMVSRNVNEIRTWHVVPRFFFENLHNTIPFLCTFAQNFGSRVQKYMHAHCSPPPQINMKNCIIYALGHVANL